MLTRAKTNHKTGERTAERVYLITSLRPEQASAGELAGYIRGHWGMKKTSSTGSGTSPWAKTAHRSEQATHHTSWPPSATWPWPCTEWAQNQCIAKAMRIAGRDPRIARNLIGL